MMQNSDAPSSPFTGPRPTENFPSTSTGTSPMSPWQSLGNVGSRTIEITLDQELLGSLCRRSRRRLRDIQQSCGVLLKLDRSKSLLRIAGSEVGIQAVKMQLASLAGPRRPVPAAVWAELMRTRTMNEIEQASVAQIQHKSGCRVHIERSRHEVRLFGPDEATSYASQLIDEMSNVCVEEIIPVANPAALKASHGFQVLAHACGVTLRVESQASQVVVLGLTPAVQSAAAELRAFVADPENYKLPVLPPEVDEALRRKAQMNQDGENSEDDSEDDSPPPPRRQEPVQTRPIHQQQERYQPPSLKPRPQQMPHQPITFARQMPHLQHLMPPQQAPRAANSPASAARKKIQPAAALFKDNSVQGRSCPTCGSGRCCVGCGRICWVIDPFTMACLNGVLPQVAFTAVNQENMKMAAVTPGMQLATPNMMPVAFAPGGVQAPTALMMPTMMPFTLVPGEAMGA